MQLSAPNRILAVRVGRGGDLVMLTPALRLLLDAFPGAMLDLWTGPDGPRVLRGFDPRLANFLVDPRRFPAAFFARRRRARELAHAGYDRVYVFESHPRYRKLTEGIARARSVLGSASPREHYSDRCLDLVESSLPSPLHRPWATLPVTAEARAKADAYLKTHGVHEGDVLVGLHLTFSESARGLFAGARGRKHRQWSLSEAAALVRALAAERPDVRCVIDVLPEEHALLAPLLAQAGKALTVLSGPPDFERYKAVLARLRVLVTPNTGPMHVAAAVGTPVVALFSGWSPAECGPFVPPERALILRAEDMPDPHRGLAAIPASAVLTQVKKLL
jgi:ADP-heptose:LPS heptosyltransferase